MAAIIRWASSASYSNPFSRRQCMFPNKWLVSPSLTAVHKSSSEHTSSPKRSPKSTRKLQTINRMLSSSLASGSGTAGFRFTASGGNAGYTTARTSIACTFVSSTSTFSSQPGSPSSVSSIGISLGLKSEGRPWLARRDSSSRSASSGRPEDSSFANRLALSLRRWVFTRCSSLMAFCSRRIRSFSMRSASFCCSRSTRSASRFPSRSRRSCSRSISRRILSSSRRRSRSCFSSSRFISS
mmetsp:Transcript_40883/g.68470  ORF Transcript_40883/g.68470 Transcript_40883/m.68470 type:complete len:240 (-) Transcript_40883:476-1195(-)